MSIAHKIDRLERLLSLTERLSQLREARQEQSLRAVADRFTPGRTLKASSAEAILKTCLRRTGFTKLYRRGKLTGQQRLELLHEIRVYGMAWLHHEAAQFLAATDADHDQTSTRSLIGAVGQHAKRLFGRMKQFVKELYVAGAMAVLGPRALTESELRAIDQQHAVQVQYFDRFEQETGKQEMIKGPDGTPIPVGPKPEQPLDGTFPARAELYGASVWGTAQQVARDSAASKFSFERRKHILKDKPCVGCREELAKGWQPIGTLRAIGECECRVNCHCFFIYKINLEDHAIYSPSDDPDVTGLLYKNV